MMKASKNTSPFVIYGAERRRLKKELSELKYHLKMQPHFKDLGQVYGTYNESIENEWEQEMNHRVSVLTTMLEELLLTPCKH